MSEHIQPAYATDLFKHAMRVNMSWELLRGVDECRTPIYRKRSRWWLSQRRVTNWALFRLLAWAERREFVAGGDCYECQGYPEPTTDATYFVGWGDEK